MRQCLNGDSEAHWESNGILEDKLAWLSRPMKSVPIHYLAISYGCPKVDNLLQRVVRVHRYLHACFVDKPGNASVDVYLTSRIWFKSHCCGESVPIVNLVIVVGHRVIETWRTVY